VPVIPATDLRLIEVFSSLQGEGVLIGRRQLFVRLAGCNLDCAYCDTDFQAGPVWNAEFKAGERQSGEYPNPASPETLTELICNWRPLAARHHSLALTGGEPLIQAQELANWLPSVSHLLPVYLETNGTLPDALSAVLPFITFVSMDIKLASATGVATPWDAHVDFLSRARSKACQVKVVIDEQTAGEDVIDAAHFMRRHGDGIPLVLQPRTVAGRPVLTGQRLLLLQDVAAAEYSDTLVIPQVHPLLDLR
jgi:organic radical activating enzyme